MWSKLEQLKQTLLSLLKDLPEVFNGETGKLGDRMITMEKTKPQLLYDESFRLLGEHLTLDEEVSKEFGCCQALSLILLRLGYPIPKGGISGTYTMYEWLQKNFQSITDYEVGAVLIYVTGTGTVDSHGHVFVCGKYSLMSNDSESGLWKAYWTKENAKSYYEGRLLMKPHYFRAL